MSSPDPGWFGEFISYLNGTSQWNSLEVLAKSRTFLLPPPGPIMSFWGLGRLWPRDLPLLGWCWVQVTISARCSRLSCVPNNNSPVTRTWAAVPNGSEGRTKYVMSKKVMSSYEFNMLWLYICIYTHDISGYIIIWFIPDGMLTSGLTWEASTKTEDMSLERSSPPYWVRHPVYSSMRMQPMLQMSSAGAPLALEQLPCEERHFQFMDYENPHYTKGIEG